MGSILAEYVWIDGTDPVPKLRSKTKVVNVEGVVFPLTSYPVNLNAVPVWGFDGSSTNQSEGKKSDCILKPVRVVNDPLRPDDSIIVLCEVLDSDGNPDRNNNRNHAESVAERHADKLCLFGIEQEYIFYKGHRPLGWPDGGYPAPQGPFYCGVGADEVFGRDIAEEHMQACLSAGIKLSGVNAEVMPGQWEFQIGPADILMVGDHLWIARYLLYRIAEKHGVNIKLDSKPIGGDWNGSGAHTNFSTVAMREDGGIEHCIAACEKIKESFLNIGFPKVYGHGYKDRLTGAHETCSHSEFKYGVGDRTASLRIPLHVDQNKKGYIEDRRPCANIDPYEVCSFVVETVCD